MLARRLLLLIAVLLVMGAIASAIAPRDTTNDEKAGTTTTTATAPTTPTQPAAGTTVTAELPGPDAGKPKVVRAHVGDLIDLTVRVTVPGTVTIEGYDDIQPAEPASPARFSVFAGEPGSFAVSLQETGTVLGRVDIERRA